MAFVGEFLAGGFLSEDFSGFSVHAYQVKFVHRIRGAAAPVRGFFLFFGFFRGFFVGYNGSLEENFVSPDDW